MIFTRLSLIGYTITGLPQKYPFLLDSQMFWRKNIAYSPPSAPLHRFHPHAQQTEKAFHPNIFPLKKGVSFRIFFNFACGIRTEF
jgi:hypothetical protein